MRICLGFCCQMCSSYSASCPEIVFLSIDHFTVVCLVAWPLNESEAGVDLVLTCTYHFSYANFY